MDETIQLFAECLLLVVDGNVINLLALVVDAFPANGGGLAIHGSHGRWRYDRRSEAIPETYLGTINEWLWRAFKSGAPMSLGIRQLRSILGATPAQAVGFPHGNSPAFEIPAAGGTVVVSPPRWLPKIRGDLVTRADARRRRFRCKRPR